MDNLFKARNELKIGKIVEVAGNSLRIEIDSNVNDLIRTVDGQVYSIGQMGSIIKIHFGRKILFAYVRSLKMRSELEIENHSGSTDDSQILEADLFGQGTWSAQNDCLDFIRGVETYPLPLQSAYTCLNTELEAVYKAAEHRAEQGEISPMVAIGNYIGANNAVCRANIDKLFGHHFAILGSTGSGKSGTVASLLHSVLEHKSDREMLKPAIVMIDPHGEYAKAFGEKAKVYRAYGSSAVVNADSEMIKLPYWLMSADELRSLIVGKTEHEATAQNNMIYEAVNFARLSSSGIIADVGEDPVGAVKYIPADGKNEDDILLFDRDKPLRFDLNDIVKSLDKIQGRKPGSTDYLAKSNDDRVRIEGLLKKIRILRSNPQLNFLLNNYDKDQSPKLEDIIAQFFSGTDEKFIRIIDISGLPNEVAGPLTALISRLLFQYKLWQTREEREKDPVLFICEEAHRYVPNHGEAQYKEAQEAIRRIAREGRKYGLGLGLISQRPSDVESTVLSQCNSWIVLRLSNASDQEHVARFLPDSLSGLTKMLSSLTRREAIFVGEAAALPSRIKINELPADKLPDSNDIRFAKGWSGEAISHEGIAGIVSRWSGMPAKGGSEAGKSDVADD